MISTEAIKSQNYQGSSSPSSPKKRTEPASPFRFEFGVKHRNQIEPLGYKRGPAVKVPSKLARGASLGLEIDTSVLPSQMSTAQPSGDELPSPEIKQFAGGDSPLLPRLVGPDSPTNLKNSVSSRRPTKIRSSNNLSDFQNEPRTPARNSSTTQHFYTPESAQKNSQDLRSQPKPSFRVRDSSSSSLGRTSILLKRDMELAVIEDPTAHPSQRMNSKSPTNSQKLEVLKSLQQGKRFSIKPAPTGMERRHQKSSSCIPVSLYSLGDFPEALSSPPTPLLNENDAGENYKLGFKYEISSLTGFNPQHQKENQDYARVHSFLSPSPNNMQETTWLFILGDGHGTHGGLASKTAVDKIVQYVEQEFQLCSTRGTYDIPESKVKEIIHSSFEKTQQELKHDPQDRFRSSGTTLVLVVFYREVFYFCNVGDSKVIFCATGAHKAQVLCKFESLPHKPNDPQELKRIEAAGGQVWVLVDENSQRHVAPPRVWNRSRTEPGLATSRSLGDTYGHTIGLSFRPGKTKFSSQTSQPRSLQPRISIWCLHQTGSGM